MRNSKQNPNPIPYSATWKRKEPHSFYYLLFYSILLLLLICSDKLRSETEEEEEEEGGGVSTAICWIRGMWWTQLINCYPVSFIFYSVGMEIFHLLALIFNWHIKRRDLFMFKIFIKGLSFVLTISKLLSCSPRFFMLHI